MGRKVGFTARLGVLFPAKRAVVIFSSLSIILFVVGGLHNLSVTSELKRSQNSFRSVNFGSRVDWKHDEELPEFCKALIANPVPRSRYCDFDRYTMKCRNSSTEYQMFSQFEQDDFVYHGHFRYLKRPGIYLDIAANDPVSLSNTFFMDRCLGWQGICVEANRRYYESLYRLRSCQLVPTCVGSIDGETVEFLMKGGRGGILDESYKNERSSEQSDQQSVIKMRCTTMKNVLERHGVTVVDFLSLDVEGHELQVLKGFDWDNVMINVMVIEVSGATKKPIEEFLTPKGYRTFIPEFNGRGNSGQMLRGEAVFLHESVEFGKPR